MAASDYPVDMDPECVRLCDFVNSCAGLSTFESCCGHGRHEFMVFFTAKDLLNLRAIAEPLSMGTAWSLGVGWANGGNRIYFGLEGLSLIHI